MVKLFEKILNAVALLFIAGLLWLLISGTVAYLYHPTAELGNALGGVFLPLGLAMGCFALMAWIGRR